MESDTEPPVTTVKSGLFQALLHKIAKPAAGTQGGPIKDHFPKPTIRVGFLSWNVKCCLVNNRKRTLRRRTKNRRGDYR